MDHKDSFRLRDLNHFWKEKFKTHIPRNLNPSELSIHELLLDQNELADYNKYKLYIQDSFFESLMGQFQLPALNAEEEEKVKRFKQIHLDLNKRNSELNSLYLAQQLPETASQTRKRNRESIVIYYLANALTLSTNHLGLQAEQLRELPVGIYQIGQQDASSKGYFVFTSTAKNRRVHIRFMLWSQYDNQRLENQDRLADIQWFFKAFETFEKQARARVKKLFFYFDELGDTDVRITLSTGDSVVASQSIGMFAWNRDFFDLLLEELNTISN